MAKKIEMFPRLVYGLIGVTGVISGWAILTTFQTAFAAGWYAFGVSSLLAIGGLNWGIVALTGDKNKDLFGQLGM